jgi:glycosyltransferase involved in cell wall biosynthesis
MTNSQPTLSVMMANYNHGHLLQRAVGAILEQSVRPLELIVVDDGSTDDSVAVLERIASRDPVLRVLKNDRNRGVTYTASRALEASSGDYLYFAAADDLVLPGFFERSMRLLTQYPQAGLCCGYHSTVDGVTGEVNKNPSGWSNEPCYFSPAEVLQVMGAGGIAGHSAILKRSALMAAGGFLSELRWHTDWFASLVVAYREGMCHIPDALALMTAMPTTYSAAGVKDGTAQRETIMCLLRALRSPAYRDVAPMFRQSGILACFGPELVRAVAWSKESGDHELLSLVPPRLCQELIDDADSRVRQLARRVFPAQGAQPRRPFFALLKALAQRAGS